MFVKKLIQLFQLNNLLDFQDAIVHLGHFGELLLDLIGQLVYLVNDFYVLVLFLRHEGKDLFQKLDHIYFEFK